MLTSLLTLIVGSLADLLALALLLRFAMQWQRVSFRNPLGQFILALTNWIVTPVRKIIPGLFGLDLASFILAWLVQAVFMAIMITASDSFDGALAGGLVTAISIGLLITLRLAIYLAMGVVVVSAILSWVNPYAPIAPVFNQLAEPLLRPFRKLIPLVGGVDLSPLGALLLLQVALLLLGNLQNLLLFGQ